jgi:hypothetical protein
LLLVASENDEPLLVGVTVAGFGVQVGGGEVVPAAQLKFTAELYPFAAVNFPLKVAVWFTHADCGELLMVST